MKYSVLVNTCDKFEDCWNPFFQLFSLYWQDYKGTIYLNTEKDYSFDGLDIIPVKGCVGKKWKFLPLGANVLNGHWTLFPKISYCIYKKIISRSLKYKPL